MAFDRQSGAARRIAALTPAHGKGYNFGKVSASMQER